MRPFNKTTATLVRPRPFSTLCPTPLGKSPVWSSSVSDLLFIKLRIITEIKTFICNTSFYSQMMNEMVFCDCHCKPAHWLTCPRLVVISKVPSSDLASGTVSLPSGLTMQRLTSRPPWSHTNLVGNVRRDMVTGRYSRVTSR